ncbi:hypothetical protein CXK86_20525 [Paenibacillus sp. BGI2013]|uniref:hypothetical protein n=1 Tax=Paenibacillus sp. BGI2013 TaxID=2058902 RepID=UPI000C6DE3E5|nr:hypothetical protein [Paenibacillus sp. BGI2013]PKQ89433.1 hypothetical protein CXK86_20525 [Paenibacillus sp. BGI2013]
MKEMNKWTMKETLKGKTFSIIILTIILTIAINKLVNRIMTQEVIFEGGLYSSYTNHFSLGIYGVIFAIPAGFISILVVKLFTNKIKRQSNPFDYEKKFKWHSMYGTVCGFIILFLLLNLTNTYASQMLVSDVWDGFIHLAISFIIPIVFAVISAKLINKVMVRITNTNGRLIEEIEAGKYDREILSQRDKARMLKLLKKGSVSSLKGGMMRLKVIDFLLLVGGTIVFVLLLVLDKVVSLFSNPNHGTGWSNGESNLHEERERLKSKAYDNAEEKREQADFSKKMFVKQANYNVRYSQSEWNRAVRDEREYQRAKRDADSL